MKVVNGVPVPEIYDRRTKIWECSLPRRFFGRFGWHRAALLQRWKVEPVRPGESRAHGAYYIWRSPLWRALRAWRKDRCAGCGGRFGFLEPGPTIADMGPVPDPTEEQVVLRAAPGRYHQGCYERVREHRYTTRKLE